MVFLQYVSCQILVTKVVIFVHHQFCDVSVTFFCISSNCMAFLQYGSIQKLKSNRSSPPRGVSPQRNHLLQHHFSFKTSKNTTCDVSATEVFIAFLALEWFFSSMGPVKIFAASYFFHLKHLNTATFHEVQE